MKILVVVQAVEDYGSTHDEDLVVPLTIVTEKHPPSPSKKKITTLLFACLLGLAVATVVVSRATLFVSRMDSSVRVNTEESFFLQDRGGADDDKCVPATGPWPTGAVSITYDDDSDDSSDVHSGPYVTCYVSTTGGYCWSHSHYVSGIWDPCTPQGIFVVWAFDSQTHPETCGTPCTEFYVPGIH